MNFNDNSANNLLVDSFISKLKLKKNLITEVLDNIFIFQRGQLSHQPNLCPY